MDIQLFYPLYRRNDVRETLEDLFTKYLQRKYE